MNQFRSADAINYNGWRVNFSPPSECRAGQCDICGRKFNAALCEVQEKVVDGEMRYAHRTCVLRAGGSRDKNLAKRATK